MISLDVLAIGNLERGEDGSIITSNSTSVLIRADDRIIVVDTSTKEMKSAIKTSFKQLMVLPKDVDTVVLTHCHADHTGNIDMFPNAQILMHTGEEIEIPGVKLINHDIELSKGVKLVHTPGHTMGSMSVFIEADIKYVIAGDAIPLKDNFMKMKPPAVNCDSELALESIKAISNYADMVVPGHDFPFMTER
ncbi:MAG: MBL fold metallo-hydrolase [Candidatus Methanomethylophilaceae archaeon]|nr:MBL fold metallo-hydrolase [Candidatus Methanomethylophilaceae archaeon]MDD3378812.1 MBL fold metallo-hydrolase [Candidatus Methanomethylophilaceae archaeon]MDY0224311.1 MBL fold metallo-hydrolase [Candidatus Methanomethylophilaceae archaeon]